MGKCCLTICLKFGKQFVSILYLKISIFRSKILKHCWYWSILCHHVNMHTDILCTDVLSIFWDASIQYTCNIFMKVAYYTWHNDWPAHIYIYICTQPREWWCPSGVGSQTTPAQVPCSLGGLITPLIYMVKGYPHCICTLD